MARTAVELPDPLENPGGGATNSADDLLAQLAGDEVDRLLSEADAGEPVPLNVDRAVGADPAESADAEPLLTPVDGAAGTAEASLDELLEEIDRAQAEAPGDAAAPAGEPAEGSIERRAEQLIARARLEDEASAPAAAAAVVPPSAADALAAEIEADELAHAAALQRMKEGGAAASQAPADEADEAAMHAAPAATEIDEAAVDLAAPDPDAADERVPLLVRVLELVNAPLAGLSCGVREAIGKVALVTSVNAVAILVYVLLFRRH